MKAKDFGIFQVGVAGLKVALVRGYGLADGRWTPALDLADCFIAASEVARHFARLPEVQYGRAVGLFVVVGEGETLQPRSARPVGFRTDQTPPPWFRR